MSKCVTHYQECRGGRTACNLYENIGANRPYDVTSNKSKVNCEDCKNTLQFRRTQGKE